MTGRPPYPHVSSHPPALTARSLLAAYLLIPALLLLLWAASEPVLAGIVVAGAVAAVLATARFARRRAASRGDRPRLCVPRTTVCIRL